MKNNLLNFENIENLDPNEIYELNMKHVGEFTSEQILEFINENIVKLDFMLDAYHDANVLSPSDALSHITLSKSLQSFCLIEHWIKKHVLSSEDYDQIEEEDLEQDDEL